MVCFRFDVASMSHVPGPLRNGLHGIKSPVKSCCEERHGGEATQNRRRRYKAKTCNITSIITVTLSITRLITCNTGIRWQYQPWAWGEQSRGDGLGARLCQMDPKSI